MTKTYTKNTWTDEVLAGGARYDVLTDGGTPINEDVQINLTTPVTTAGTPVTSALMNNIENGIDTLDTAIDVMSHADKATPIDADSINLWDTVASAWKKLTWANLKATLKAYFDTLYTVIGGRTVLTANRTYYVRTDGNNNNTGLTNTAGGAFLTIQKAVDTIAASLDIAGYIVTIQVGDGTYTAGVTLKNVIGYAAAGNLIIRGNSSTPSNVVISTATATAFYANGLFSVWSVQDMRIVAATSYCFFASNRATIRFSNIDFGTTTSHHLYATGGGALISYGNSTISGGATTHYNCDYGLITDRGFTVTLTGTPAFSYAFASVNNLGYLSNDFTTYSGAATGKRYAVVMNAIIYTNGGATYLPGDSSGTSASGGQYV